MSRPDLNAVLRARAAAEACGTGNLPLVLAEVRHALDALAETGGTWVIDLSTLPMTPSEAQALDAWLGAGEVRAQVEAEGASEVAETGFAGVWRVTHRDAEGRIRGRYLEITRIPAILQSQPEDIAAAARRMARAMADFDEPQHSDRKEASCS